MISLCAFGTLRYFQESIGTRSDTPLLHLGILGDVDVLALAGANSYLLPG
jgi:hypothetical protein